MASYELVPLHSHPELIEDTISLLKEEWPHCLAERLNVIETATCTGLPCSLALTESREGAAREVLGHVRVIQLVPKFERRVNIESVTIKKTRRNEGLGRKLHELLESHAKTSLGARYLHTCVQTDRNYNFYRHLQYDCSAPQREIAANILRSCPQPTWDSNIIPDEWQHFYEGGSYSGSSGVVQTRGLVKDMGED